ncbi:MAG: hypothetical protein ABIH40_01000 [Candidatus Omnitrophota bacterium]
MKKKILLLLVLAVFLTWPVGYAFSNQQASAEEASGYPIEGWVFGDVVELDPENGQFILTYFDYRGREKEMTVKVDAETKYENVNGFEDIKAGDALSVDYLITPEGEAVALSISVERLKGAKE